MGVRHQQRRCPVSRQRPAGEHRGGLAAKAGAAQDPGNLAPHRVISNMDGELIGAAGAVQRIVDQQLLVVAVIAADRIDQHIARQVAHPRAALA